HSCGICNTPLRHPAARKTCFGKHAETCARFHHTMFRIGRARSCDACKNSNERHLKRHKDLLSLITEIQQLNANDYIYLKPTPSDIHMAIHGYVEDSIHENLESMDRAMVKDLQLEHRIHQHGKGVTTHSPKICTILGQLGIRREQLCSSKDGCILLARVEKCVSEDIEAAANQARETLRRQLGYYKYADQRKYHSMLQEL
ncbi:hypothetical protein BGW36DRAFT_258084, partial [Talaromyces proteolyticus]